MPDQLNRDLTQYSYGEKWWLSRHFTRGWTQKKMARWLEVGLGTYQAAERDERPDLPGHGHPLPNVEWSEDPVRCRLARYRWSRTRGKGLAAIAAELGITRVTLLKWEARGHPALVKYWKGKGFKGF